MEPFRILHIVQRMEAAGLQSLIMNIYRNIDRSKVQFDFLVHYTQRQFFDDEIELLGGKIYRFSVREDYNIFKYIVELNRFFKEHSEYKVVHGHMSSLGAIYLYFAKINNIKVRIAHSHNAYHATNIKGHLRVAMTKLFKFNATHLYACSELAGKDAFGKSKFKVVTNAIDSLEYSYNVETRNRIRKELGLHDKYIIGHVGRFDVQKNHSLLIDIFYEIRKLRSDAVLILIGEGNKEKEIKQKVKNLKLTDNVLFLGVRKDVNKLYQAMDVFLFPSLFEGLGIVAVEAQTSGLRTICANTIPEEARITELLELVDLYKSPKEWASIIIKNKFKSVRRDMSAFTMKAGYDIKCLAKKLEAVYINMHNI